jgi:hypothetical protein
MLTDLALRTKGFTGFAEPVYAPDEYGDDDVVDDDEEEAEDAVYHRDMDSEEEEYGGRGRAKGLEDEKAEIRTNVEPETWRSTVDRVAPHLKLPMTGDLRDWRSHLELINQLRRKIAKSSPEVLASLARVSDDVAKSAEKIAKREATLTGQFEGAIEKYRAEKKLFDDTHAGHKTVQERVEKLSTELNGVTESADSVKNEIEERNASTTDVSPLHKIRESITRRDQDDGAAHRGSAVAVDATSGGACNTAACWLECRSSPLKVSCL